MSVATAAIIGGGVAAAGAVGGALINKGAQVDATNAQVQANRESIAFQREQAEKAAALLEPFRQVQLGAVGQIQQLTTPGSDLENQQRRVATQAMQRELASQGLLRSGAQARGLGNLELGLAEQRYSRLNQLAGLGAAQGQAGIYQGLGQGIGNSLMQQGQIQAQGALAQGQASAGMFSGVGNVIQGTLGNLVADRRYRDELAFLNKRFGGA